MARKFTRREMLKLSGAAAAGSLLAACTPAATPAPVKPAATAGPTQPPAAPASKYSESPLLAERVKAGKLLPVEQRLPEEPLVIQPLQEVGQYGGTIRFGTERTDFFQTDGQYASGMNQLLLRLKPSIQEVVPNVAKAFKVSDDAKTFTISLRKGMKWSDGEPLTADDAVFYINDFILNSDLQPVTPAMLKVKGKPIQIEKIDDYTFAYKFDSPNPSFVISQLPHHGGFAWPGNQIIPAHYLKQFHIKYNPNANDSAKKAGLDFWYQYFNKQRDWHQNRDAITYGAYVVTGDTPEASSYERNPYFWAVDTKGNQLPYIDKMVINKVTNVEMFNTKAVAGEYDFACYNINIMNYKTISDSAQRNNARLLLWDTGNGGEVVYFANLNSLDPVLRPIFQDVRFRRALSLAINRKDINDTIYFGRATPRQMTVHAASKYFKDEYAKAYADFDLDKANALLDEMGLKWDANHQLRLRPDGKPLQVLWDLWESQTPRVPITDIVKEHWKKIGFGIDYKTVTRTILTPRAQASQEDFGCWHGDKSLDTQLPLRPEWYMPMYADETVLANLWALWHDTGGQKGEAPPDNDLGKEIKANWDAFDKFQETLDPQYLDRLLKSQSENIWTIGTVGMAPQLMVVKNNLRNIPETGIFAWDDLYINPYYPEQFYFKQS
jgi:peptide/nickel transport system substrate-binding protein